MKTLFSILFLLSTACASASVGSGPLHDAHRAYLAGDLTAMTRDLTLVLQQGDETESSNALALLEKAYSVNNGGVPADFKLPSEIRGLRLFVSRRCTEDIKYRIGMKGSSEQASLIKQMKVTRYPDKVVLDKNAGIGEWEEEYDKNDKAYYFRLMSGKGKDQIPGGLYFIHLELSNGTQTDGYVILSNMNATASPELVSPYLGETVTTSQPTLKWKNFLSPQHQGNEKRYLSASVIEDSEVNNYREAWNVWREDPAIEQATIGTTQAVGDTQLADGPYQFAVNYQERRRYGDIQVSRESMTVRNFIVDTKTK